MDYGEIVAAKALSVIPEGEYAFGDRVDDDGKGTDDIKIKVKLRFRILLWRWIFPAPAARWGAA
jgi:hypothetical protein